MIKRETETRKSQTGSGIVGYWLVNIHVCQKARKRFVARLPIFFSLLAFQRICVWIPGKLTQRLSSTCEIPNILEILFDAHERHTRFGVVMRLAACRSYLASKQRRILPCITHLSRWCFFPSIFLLGGAPVYRHHSRLGVVILDSTLPMILRLISHGSENKGQAPRKFSLGRSRNPVGRGGRDSFQKPGRLLSAAGQGRWDLG